MNAVSIGWLDSPLGPLVAGATAEGVCLLEFTDRGRRATQLQTVARRFGAAVAPGSSPHLDQLRSELEEYFAGRRRAFTVALRVAGTDFEERVWGELNRIPYGETRSYEDLALALGRPGAQRAVGTANGRNRVSIVIPCHRVVNKNGQLGGYGGGLWRKQALLDLERRGPSLLALEPEPA
jgi:AraC family transcriptional regulator of adaptative response/methylated-DNA-[protein]-cysteine methyltransferase